jgi:hypothetical protein
MTNNKMDDFLLEMLEDMPERKRHDWNKISRRVSVMNFFKFGLHHFNIYYTLLILGSLSGITGSFLNLNNHPELVAGSKISNNSQSKTLVAGIIGAPHLGITKNAAISKRIEVKQILKHINRIEADVELDTNMNIDELADISENFKNKPVEIPLVPLEEITSKEQNIPTKKSNSELAPTSAKKAKLINTRWSVEMYSQPVFSDAFSVSSSIGTGPQGSENDKQKYAYGMNLSLSINHFQLQTGLLYLYSSKNYSNTIEREEVTTVKSYKKYSSITYSLESGNEMRVRTDSVLVTSQKVENKSYFLNNVNSYKCLEMPLIAGYKIWYHRFSFAVKGGVVLSLYKNANGVSSNSNLLLGLNKIPFLSPDLTITGSIGAYYRINSNVNFMFEPYFRRNFNSLGNNKIGILPTTTASGIRVGFAYDF